MNVLFKNRDFSGWRGGLNYYNNLLRALSTYAGNRNYLLVEDKQDLKTSLNTRYIDELVSISKVKRPSADWLRRQVYRPFLSDDELFAKVNGWITEIDVAFEVYDRNLNEQLPTIFWIPDFQHVYLPDYFSDDEIDQRDRGFRFVAKHADVILVSSYDAKYTCAELYQEYADKIEVLHFCTPVPASLKQLDRPNLLQKYNIETDFVYLPNQYWKHKNHELVVDALHMMDKSDRTLVISSGPSGDYRNPGHFDALMAKVTEYDLKNRYRYIGEIPYEDVMGLMYSAKAVINPSFFEGWSTTVQEAKSLGKKLLLSDISVHREQAPGALFFDPESPEDLAASFEKINAVPYQLVEINAVEQKSRENIQEMVQRFLDIANTAKSRFGKVPKKI